jgi:hypothetical protein
LLEAAGAFESAAMTGVCQSAMPVHSYVANNVVVNFIITGVYTCLLLSKY